MIRFVTVLLAFASLASGQGSKSCGGCHADIYRSYRDTGMARSFFRPAVSNTIEDYTGRNQFFHAASETHYEMVARDGKYFQRRYQTGYDGKPANFDEQQIDFVMGSGTHARSYLHRTSQGTLVQLPLGWYRESGWGMSPGYDLPNHPDAQRPIGYDCMFCHNAYPKVAASKDRFGDVPRFPASLPEGIDCQRCHGSGERHIAAPSAAEKRASIVNPAKLTLERQAEVCLQCHLQPDSLKPTLNFKRYGRQWFSYQPNEPLTEFLTFFDAPDPGRFQIAGSAYRLRQSACFLKSANGALQCTSCHNPHEARHGSADDYDKVCAKCHAGAFQASVAAGKHTSAGGCAGCHMPARRTQDVVHVVMTDHKIQRKPGADLLAQLAEVHDGVDTPREVRPYYPKAAGRMESAVAQVRAGASATPLTRLLKEAPPAMADPFFEAAQAAQSAGHPKDAAPLYREALRRDPGYLPALLGAASALLESGDRAAAADALRRAAAMAPDDARAWAALGSVTMDQSALRKAAELDPDDPAPHIGLGILLAQSSSLYEAEGEFRQAIRIHPNSAEVHGYLANVLIAAGDVAQAAWEFERAIRLSPRDVALRVRYAGLLYTMNQGDAAIKQADAAVELQPASAEAHHLKGNLLEKQRRVKEALVEYTEAVRLAPQMGRAQLDLGAVLAETGDKANAIAHLKRAAVSDDETVRRIAVQTLADLGIR